MPITKVIVEPSEEVQQLPSPHGAELDSIRRRLQARGKTVYDIGRIAPPVPERVTEILRNVDPARPVTRIESEGIERQLREKIAAWVSARFGVILDPEREILLTTGNTPGVFFAFQAFCNPGDTSILPDPAFSLYRSSAIAVGSSVQTYEVSPRTDFLPNLEIIRAASNRSCKILLVNYPHNPTSTSASENFYDKLVRFAKKKNTLVLSDAVYNTHVWDRHPHPAIIAIPKAKHSCVELFTFSFMYNLPLLKLGFAVGCREFLTPLTKLMSSFNSRPSGFDLQIGDTLMDYCDDICGSVARTLGENRSTLEPTLKRLGWDAQPSHASPFVWVKTPRRRLSLNFCRTLLKRSGVLVLPGSSFGEIGEGYIRLSLATEPETLRAASERLLEYSKSLLRRFRKSEGS